MTEVLPRLEGAFDGSDRKTLDRRQLLKAGAWAAPVIVLATAAPAAANTSGNTTPTSGAKATVHMYNFSQQGITTHWSAAKNANVVDALKGQLTFQSDWSSSVAVTSATVTLTVTSATGLLEQKAVVADNPNWKSTSVSKVTDATGSAMIYVFTFVGSVSAQQTCPPLIYSLLADGQSTGAEIGLKQATGVFSSPQASSTTASVSWS